MTTVMYMYRTLVPDPKNDAAAVTTGTVTTVTTVTTSRLGYTLAWLALDYRSA